VDQLRQELGQSPVPNLQETLEERKREYLAQQLANPPQQQQQQPKNQKRSHSVIATTGPGGNEVEAQVGKRPRGRPKGSKTKKKAAADNVPKEGESIMIP